MWRIISSWVLLLLLLASAATCPRPVVCKHKSAKGTRHGAAAAEWTSLWASVADIPTLAGPEFTVATRFLLEMCAKAYEYDYQQKEPLHPLPPVPGWSLSTTVDPISPPRTGAAGLRGLVYVEDPKPLEPDATSRTVIVFRGWQTTSTSHDELADLCAGKRLFPHYVDFLSPPPPLCSFFFDDSNLDYLSQAIAYTRLVLTYYEPSTLLLTGHGLGAGLAVLVSAALQNELHEWCSSHDVSGLASVVQGGVRSNEQRHMVKTDLCRVTLPAVTFSGPGVDAYLDKQGWKIYEKDYIITISNRWDFFSVRAQWRDHIGWLCLYDMPEPIPCRDCFSDELHAFSLEMLKAGTSSLDKNFKGKAKKKDHDGDDDNDDEDEDDDDEDDNDADNHDAKDDDHDDCSCDYDKDDPCWDCLPGTHTLESIKKASDATPLPTCKFYK